jgi:hypothetical protein
MSHVTRRKKIPDLLSTTTSTEASDMPGRRELSPLGIMLSLGINKEEDLSLIIPEDSFDAEPSLLESLTNSVGGMEPRRKSVHDLQSDLDVLLKDVTNLLDTCLLSPFIPRTRRASK